MPEAGRLLMSTAGQPCTAHASTTCGSSQTIGSRSGARGAVSSTSETCASIRQVVNDALVSLDAEFAALYADFGRPSIAPERLIRASLLQILFSIRVTPEACFQHDAAVDGADAV